MCQSGVHQALSTHERQQEGDHCIEYGFYIRPLSRKRIELTKSLSYLVAVSSSYFLRTSRMSSHINALGEPGSRVGLRSR